MRRQVAMENLCENDGYEDYVVGRVHRHVGDVLQRHGLSAPDLGARGDIDLRPLDEGADGGGEATGRGGGEGWLGAVWFLVVALSQSVYAAFAAAGVAAVFWPAAHPYVAAAVLAYELYFGFHLGRFRAGAAAPPPPGWVPHRVVIPLTRDLVRTMADVDRVAAAARALGPGFLFRAESPSAGDAATSEDLLYVIEWNPRLERRARGRGWRWGLLGAPKGQNTTWGDFAMFAVMPWVGLWALAVPGDAREADLPRVDPDPLLDRRPRGGWTAGALARAVAAKAWRDVVRPGSWWTWGPLLIFLVHATELHNHWAGYARPAEGMWAVYRIIGQLALGQRYYYFL